MVKYWPMPLATIEEAIDDIRRGRMVILMDDKDRENEGDLCMAAEKVTPEAINFMATHGRGLICLPLTEERVRHLGIAMMVSDNTSPFGTAFTVSIDSASGITTGISAADRAKTILDAIADDAKPQDLVTPGHIFPLRARNGGVLVRAGQTEGSVDLARLAGLKPAGVICEIMKDDGTMARQPDLMRFAKKHKLKVVTNADLIQHRLNYDSLVYKAARRRCRPALAAMFQAIVYNTHVDESEHLALDQRQHFAEGRNPGAGPYQICPRRCFRFRTAQYRRGDSALHGDHRQSRQRCDLVFAAGAQRRITRRWSPTRESKVNSKKE